MQSIGQTCLFYHRNCKCTQFTSETDLNPIASTTITKKWGSQSGVREICEAKSLGLLQWWKLQPSKNMTFISDFLTSLVTY